MTFPPAFEWDGVKREINLKEHRIDFRDAPSIFDGPHLIWSSSRKGEHRLLGIGLLEEKEVVVVFTIQNGIRRIISIRRARTYERQAFQDALPRLRSSP